MRKPRAMEAEPVPTNSKPYIKKPWERHREHPDLGDNVSMTDKSAGNDTDVNKIVARFSRTGQLPEGQGQGQFADVTHLQGDLAEMLDRGKDAAKELEELRKKDELTKAEQAEKDRLELEEFRRKQKELELDNSDTPPGDKDDM